MSYTFGVKKHYPKVYDIVMKSVEPNADRRSTTAKEKVNKPRKDVESRRIDALYALASLMYARSERTNLPQIINSFIMCHKNTPREMIDMLNKQGYCVSYQTTLTQLEELKNGVLEKRRAFLQSGNYCIVLDNIDFNLQYT